MLVIKKKVISTVSFINSISYYHHDYSPVLLSYDISVLNLYQEWLQNSYNSSLLFDIRFEEP